MPKLFFLAATVHLLFFLYLLLVGAGLARAIRIAFLAIGASAACGLFAFFVYPYFFVRPVESSISVTLGSTLLVLPIVVLLYARDLIVPHVSILQVVLVNVLALLFAQDSQLIGLLLNPLHPIFPSLGLWPVRIISLWPTWLAVALARKGVPGDLRLRFILSIWVQVVGLLWLLPEAFHAMSNFDPTSLWSYGKSLVGSLCAVQLVLSALTLFVLVGGRDRNSEDSKLARMIAERLDVVPANPIWLLIAGAGWWLLLLWGQRMLSSLQSGFEVGAYVIAAASGGIATWRTAEITTSRPVQSPAKQSEKRPRTRTEETRAESGFSLWRFRGLFFLLAFTLSLLWFFNVIVRDVTLVVGKAPASALLFVYGIWIILVSGACYVLLRLIWVVAESQGHPPTRRTRWLALATVMLLLSVWQWLTLPRVHTPGGLDGQETTLENQSVFLWYAHDLGFLGHSGRAVYLEDSLGQRRRLTLCGADQRGPVQSFRVHAARKTIECRWPDRVIMVHMNGEEALVHWGVGPPLPIAPLSTTKAGCVPVGETSSDLNCKGEVVSLTQALKAPGMSLPVSWNFTRASQFEITMRSGAALGCIELGVIASIEGEAPASVPAVVLYNPAWKPSPYSVVWIYDRGASCRRVYEDLNGSLRYEWDALTAPLKGETHVRVPPIVYPPQQQHQETSMFK